MVLLFSLFNLVLHYVCNQNGDCFVMIKTKNKKKNIKLHDETTYTCMQTNTHTMKITILGHDEIVHKILKFYLVALTTLHRVRSGNIIFICKHTHKKKKQMNTSNLFFSSYCLSLFPVSIHTLSLSVRISMFFVSLFCAFYVVYYLF